MPNERTRLLVEGDEVAVIGGGNSLAAQLIKAKLDKGETVRIKTPMLRREVKGAPREKIEAKRAERVAAKTAKPKRTRRKKKD